MIKLLSLLLGGVVVGVTHAHELPHMDLELSSDEYRTILAQQPTTLKTLMVDDGPVAQALLYGNRLSKWLSVLNANRAAAAPLRLSSPERRTSYTLEHPYTYSVEIIRSRTQEVISELPAEMKSVLLEGLAYPTTLTVDEATFTTLARKIDYNYQMAARYTAINPFRARYKERATKDVRGIYYLKEKKIGAAELSDVTKLPPAQLPELKRAMISLCRNDASVVDFACPGIVEEAFAKNAVLALYESAFPQAQEIWDSFFTIADEDVRRDVTWEENKLWVPFIIPDEEKFKNYLLSNIEAEYVWKDWALKLDFGRWRNGPRLRFEAGVMPNVNTVGGNVITMDRNQPIEEFQSQWIIRHEFGHVIGLPDCYHEFYDVEEEAYVSYKLDAGDLMCSRSGQMNERIYKELKRVYE